MTILTTYPLVVGGGGTTLSSSYTPGDSSISVADSSNLANAPNYVSVIDTDYVITLLYTTKTSTTISGLTIVEYSVNADSHTYASGCKVARTICKADIDTINNNVTAVTYKHVQSGTDDPEDGFEGDPVQGDVYIKYSA